MTESCQRMSTRNPEIGRISHHQLDSPVPRQADDDHRHAKGCESGPCRDLVQFRRVLVSLLFDLKPAPILEGGLIHYAHCLSRAQVAGDACIIERVSLVKRVPLLRDVGRATFRAPKRVRKALKSVRRGARIVKHVLRYRAPDELDACPACTSSALTPLMPIPLEGRSRTYGFASGCDRCGVVFANPLPDAAQVAAVYSPEGEWGRHRQDEQEKQVSQARLQRLFEPVAETLDVLHPPPNSRVVDFGCGLGGMLDAFAAVGWETYGIETAMKTAFTRHRELVVLPAAPTFDIAVLHHVLEHVTEPLTILKQIAGAMREGGLLLISVPNLDDVAVHGEMKYCIRAGVHVLAYTGDSLRWLAAEAGFEVMSDRAGLNKDRLRQRIVLARRCTGPINKPAAPLGAARRAINGYFARGDKRDASHRLPVRMQAALLDLQRTEWRI